jgi:hypothetical protein
VLHEKHCDEIEDAIDAVLFLPICPACKLVKALAEPRMRTKPVRIICQGVPIRVAACVQELGIVCDTVCMKNFIEDVIVGLGNKNAVIRS